MHSVIERAATRKDIFTVDEWCDLMRSAKVNEPKYNVNQISQNQIFNFVPLVDKKSWKKIQVTKLTMVQVTPDGQLVYCKNYEQRNVSVSLEVNHEPVEEAYTEKIALSSEKKKDLQELMSNKLIPTKYHEYYQGLM